MQKIVQALVFLLLGAAVFAAFNLPELVREARRRRFNERIRREPIIGHQPNRFEKYRNRQRHLMRVTGVPLAVFMLLTAAAIVFGFIIGKMMFEDNFLACAMAAAFLVVPSLYLEMENNKRRNYDAEKLESAMSIITNSYLSNRDIIIAIESSLPVLEYKKPFEEFTRELHYFSSNVEAALLRMEQIVPNKFFLQWVDTLILAQDDHIQMQSLPAIIDQMNEQRKSQIEADTAMVAIWREYILMLVMICTIPLLFRLAMYRGYELLVTTFMGRALMLGIIASMLHSLKRAVHLNRPVRTV